MTPTAEHADIVLPKTTTLEEEDVSFMPSGPTVLFTRALAPPQGEARCEIDIALPLLQRWPSGRQSRGTCCRGARSASSTVICWEIPVSASRSWSGPATSKSTPTPRHARSSGRLPRAPARSNCIRRVLAELGLDPLPTYTAPSRTAAAGSRDRTSFPLDARHGRSREELPPFALPRPALGAKGVARSAAYHAPRDGARLRARRRRLGASGSGARQAAPAGCASSSRMPRRRTWSTPAWAGGSPAIPRPSMAPSTSISTPRSTMMDPTIPCQGRATFAAWPAGSPRSKP